jgi:hypothetical protein
LFSQLPHELLADTDLNFDSQAFFDDYMFSGEDSLILQCTIGIELTAPYPELENQNDYDPGPRNYGNM